MTTGCPAKNIPMHISSPQKIILAWNFIDNSSATRQYWLTKYVLKGFHPSFYFLRLQQQKTQAGNYDFFPCLITIFVLSVIKALLFFIEVKKSFIAMHARNKTRGWKVDEEKLAWNYCLKAWNMSAWAKIIWQNFRSKNDLFFYEFIDMKKRRVLHFSLVFKVLFWV